jgi:hypothetical protein
VRNLPPGVSVSDLPGTRPGSDPACRECSAPENRAAFDEDLRTDGGPPDLFVSAVDLDRGGNTVHVYDRDKTDPGARKETWRRSLCGQSSTKTTQARSLRANMDAVDCGSCLRIIDSLRDETGTRQDTIRTDGGENEDDGDGGWNPEPASLRDGETTDISAHARRNLEQIQIAVENGDLDEDDVDEETQADLERIRNDEDQR